MEQVRQTLRTEGADPCVHPKALYSYPRELLEHVGPDRHTAMTAPNRVGNLRHVDVATGVGTNSVGGDEVPRSGTLTLVSKTDQHPAAHIHDCDPAGFILLDLPAPIGALSRDPPQLRNIDQAVPDAEAGGSLHVCPLFDELPRQAENLDSIVFPVSHENALVGKHPDVVGQVELTGAGTGFAPGLNQFPVGGEMMDAGIAITVRNIQVAVGGNCNAGRAVERGTAVGNALAPLLFVVSGIGRHTGCPKDHQLFSIGGELADGVITIIYGVHRSIWSEPDAVGSRSKDPLPPSGHESPILFIYDHPGIAARDEVDAVFGVHPCTDAVQVFEVRGELLPALYQLIPKLGHNCFSFPHVIIDLS